jgi:hypothetical protein
MDSLEKAARVLDLEIFELQRLGSGWMKISRARLS